MGAMSGESEMARPQRPRHHHIHKESTGGRGTRNIPLPISPLFSETNYCRYFFILYYFRYSINFQFSFLHFPGRAGGWLVTW